jgi:hypothetical protein
MANEESQPDAKSSGDASNRADAGSPENAESRGYAGNLEDARSRADVGRSWMRGVEQMRKNGRSG